MKLFDVVRQKCSVPVYKTMFIGLFVFFSIFVISLSGIITANNFYFYLSDSDQAQETIINYVTDNVVYPNIYDALNSDNYKDKLYELNYANASVLINNVDSGEQVFYSSNYNPYPVINKYYSYVPASNHYGGTNWYSIDITVNTFMDSKDTYSSFYKILHILYNLRYVVIISCAVSAIICIMLISCLIAVRKEKYCDTVWNKLPAKKLPNELRILLPVFIAITVSFLFSTISHQFITFLGYCIILLISFIICAILCSVMSIWLVLNVIDIVKKHSIYSGLILPKLMKKAKKVLGYTLSTVVKVSLCIIFAIAIMVISKDEKIIIISFISSVIYIFFTIYHRIMLNRLNKGSEEIANGLFDTVIETSSMPYEYALIGNHLNSLRDVTSAAIAERTKSERMKTELITNVSHDIKTPLTSIINYVDLMRRENIEDDTIKGYLEVLDRQSAKMKRLIEDLIEVSKASTGNLEMHFDKCDLGMLLSQTVGEFQEKAEKNNLEIVYNPEKELYINADGRHLFRVFDNLLSNACKYSLPGSRIFISISKRIDSITVIFKNTSKDQLTISPQELTERFVRGDISRNSDGNGLGLAIAKNLTELMNGKLIIDMDGDLFKASVTFPASQQIE